MDNTDDIKLLESRIPSDEELAKSIHNAVKELNKAVDNACSLGLKVDLDVRNYHAVGSRHTRYHVVAEVAKPITP